MMPVVRSWALNSSSTSWGERAQSKADGRLATAYWLEFGLKYYSGRSESFVWRFRRFYPSTADDSARVPDRLPSHSPPHLAVLSREPTLVGQGRSRR